MTYRSASEILDEARIMLRNQRTGRNYTTCPQCSITRKRAHQKSKCLSVLIDSVGVQWRCHHCGWKGGKFYENKHHGAEGGGVVREPQHRSGDGRKVRDLYR
jgi:hypothetical protein